MSSLINEKINLDTDARWTLIEAFFREKGLVRQHLDSYNRFITHGIKESIKDENVITTNIPGLRVEVRDIYVGEPMVREVDGSENRSITPMECRLRNLTYSAPIYAKLVLCEGNVCGEPEEVVIGEMPIMLKSIKDRTSRMPPEELIRIGEDPKDPGGYFIINGSERVLVIQEDLAINRILVDKGREGTNITHTAKVISATVGYRIPIILDRHKDGTLHLSFPPIPGKVPFVIMMRALGLETDEEIVLAVSPDPDIQSELLPSLQQAQAIATTEDALDFIGSRVAIGQVRESRIERAKQLLDKYFLPHIGTEGTEEIRRKKALFLGQMACKLIELVLGRRGVDDKDHYANKRLKLAGDLLAMLFRSAFRGFVRDLRYQLERSRSRGKRVKLSILIRSDIITERIRHAMATGNWVGGRTGVSQILDRTNWISMLSHLRRVVSPLSRGQPHFEARDLHATQWGRLCPFETPEGPNCGLVKNLALMAYISVGMDEKIIERLLIEKLGVMPAIKVLEMIRRHRIGAEELFKYSKIFLNGTFIGYHRNGAELAEKIRQLRRKGEIPHEVNVAHYKTEYIDEVYVNCDAGRIRRPLLVLENGELKLTQEHIEKLKRGEISFDDLVKKGVIEYLDAEEEENAYIALNPKDVTPEHTHLEIWPPSILGIAAATIPFAEHNQSPRNAYQAAMVKQALGLYAANYQLRMDSRSHLLHYPQKPLVQTRMLNIIGYNERPAGQNMIVAVMSFTGYNMEDAIIMNLSSVERGLARSTFFRTYITEERKYAGGLEDRIEIPSPQVWEYKGAKAYELLDEDGIVKVEAEVKSGHVLIGKTSPSRFAEEYRERGIGTMRRKDASVTIRHGEKGIVDSIVITTSQEGYKLVKVKVRDLRIPELGDKFASRHGQKGVIGMLIPQYDLPYTVEGITPDLIINPHALPSRMTLGQLMESIAGKVAALRGKEVDGTPFFSESIEDLKKSLLLMGYPLDGTEPMYDGRTGELIGTPIFIGIVYYQKLHHMVADKMHARARGPIQILTRQPTEGRAREGGLRFGEMERDTLIGHGAVALLRERLLESSDRTYIYVCELCGHIGWFNRTKNTYECPVHGDKGIMHKIEVSYAFKLLLQELMSMLIRPKIILGDRFELAER